ncbi:MAG: biosynthetic arginine decarboxylase [Pyrinomonadaceae bacterium]|nr:biosynthetic arginine decarboxylase [Pyrinomonadaceae bacterium]
MSATIEQTIETYGIENWGAGYFGVNRKGNLIVRASENDSKNADVKEIIEDLKKRGIHAPVLLRFPQLLVGQIRKLHKAFKNSIKEFDYKGNHMCVYPMKVNQNRAVVEEYLKEGSRYDFGLEAGSKAELYAALAMDQADDSLLVLNGFKDEEFIRLAFAGAMAGKNVVIVIEKLSELENTIKIAEEVHSINPKIKIPMVGVRVKLYSKGSGKWEKSGGEAAKFGLTTTEILEVIKRLNETGRADMLRLLHFHIGSQLTDIKRIKNAMKEAARVYSKIRKLGMPIEFLDVGGGMAVDYDGSKTSFESSANYNAQEFANDVIYVIKTVCDDENVQHPNIIQESGRFLSAYHAILVANIQDEIETVVEDHSTPITVDENDPQVVKELFDLRENINGKNYQEYYHDALENRDELFTMFNLGLISLEDRAKGEVLFWDICEGADQFAQQKKYVSEEFDDLRRLLCAKYLANFSVFRSMPDNWALEQLFPIVPIHKLNKKPTEYATLCDITCDSDGIVDKFVDLHDVKPVLELHKLDGEPYYLAMMLVGAYQECMGNNHNLFGLPHEAHIHIDEDGYIIKKVIHGSNLGDSLAQARYDNGQLHDNFRRIVMQRIKDGEVSPKEGNELIEFYEKKVGAYTYLSQNGN